MSEEWKKYEMLPTPITVSAGGKSYTAYKIKALNGFADVAKGQTGGAVSSESNLSQFGDCWIYDSAAAVGNAKVYGNAVVADSAEVYDCAKLGENGIVKGNAKVYDCARVLENAVVDGNTKVRRLMRVYGENCVKDENWE